MNRKRVPWWRFYIGITLAMIACNALDFNFIQQLAVGFAYMTAVIQAEQEQL